MKKRLLERTFGSLILILACFISLAQDRTVTGKVTDSTGQPLSGASVLVKGAKTGTQTNNDGTFRLKVPATAKTLIISSIGYGSREVALSAGFVSISLTQTSSSLSDVIVIGYGTVKKKDLTGSVSTITSKDFQTGNITTPEQMIAGKVAGVSIISNSGQPGSGSTIRIRGGSSLNASNDPLIVIDGVPLSNDVISGASNSLSFINPNDIESFTVLKDASAAAIYGTRASNGVIIITTKKGSSENLKINLSSVNSISSISKKVDILSAGQFRAIVNANGATAQKAMMGTANTDWQNQIYQDAIATTNNISISGGIKKFPYRISLGYQNQTGVLKTDNLQRTSLAIALNPSFFDNHLKIDINLKGSLEKARFANTSAIGGAVTFDPTQPVYSNTKRYNGYFEWVDASGKLVDLVGRNPVGLLNQQISKGNPQRSIGNIQIDYKLHFLPELHVNLNAGYDVTKGAGTVFIPDSAASNYSRMGVNTQYRTDVQNTIFDFYLNYVKDIKSIKSHIDVLAGYSYNDYLTTTYNFADYNAHGVKILNSDPTFPLNKPRNVLISFFGRANYSFDDRYLLTATLRRDGSSRFAPGNRWGLFPAVALAWKIKNEAFLKNSKAVSDLKLRLGYGITGQQDGIGNYDYLSYYSLSAANATYQFGNTYYQMFRPGGFYANRKWEQTKTSNLGLDFGFLDNRITGSIDIYQKKTTDLLNNIPQPAGTNFSAYVIANVGDMENKGVEFNINTQPFRSNNLTWDVGFNITYNKNTITNLTVVPDDKTYIGFPSGTIAGGVGGQFAFINAVGGSKNTFYLYSQVYNKAGNPVEGVFVDKNADGIINEKDLYKGKSADPNVLVGFSTNVSYKRWNAGFVLRANIGNYVYNNIYSQTGTLNQITGNAVLYNGSSNYLVTQFGGGNGQQLLSDYYIQNASFLRMDNCNIGYNVGKFYHSRANLRINVNAQNVFVITKYKGLDPEISSGIDNNFYPRPRIISFGLNISF
jgi:TonB-linked SusC/RagA family outer membrane protein